MGRIGPDRAPPAAALAEPGARPLPPPFEILPATGRPVPVVVHLPHGSTTIPEAVRPELLLDDRSLQEEIVRLTDWLTPDLFAPALAHGATLFRATLSRLVFDPERFLDPEREPMEAVGQGVVYTRTSVGTALRAADPRVRQRRIETLFLPYHEALAQEVDAMLERWGRCTIVDGHSFATLPLPSEQDQDPDRPDICIGTDASHTPPDLAAALERAFRAEGFRVRRDSPFAGTFVPLRHHGREPRVRSVMVEVRRGLYCDESSGLALPAFADVRGAIERALVAGGVLDAG